MHRNKLAILILLIGGFGCQQPTQKRVYVDFEAVLASYKSSPLPSSPVPKPPGGLPAQAVTIPAVDPRTVVVQGTSGEKAGALLEANRKLAVQELTKVLSLRYVREVQRAAEKLIRDLDPKRQAAYASAQGAVQAEFLAYAEKRSPLIARLTSIVGFPDPNPNSLPPPASSPPFALKRLAEAAEIRKQMATLDANYENKILDLLSQAGKAYGVDLSAILKQLEVDRNSAMRRAETEAISEATKSYEALRPMIMGSTKVELPGQPAQSLELPAVPAPSAAPEVRERTLSAAERRTILDAQLQMWLKLNGYELVKDSNGGENKTEDFVKWRQGHKL